ncbi:hypothetical protein BDZ89DRAFT_1053910 [Hymenopellis radicata]|nr:hypothetical protein BDZ89DRAFT_1053910 [Hymenopellis radicata]
MKEYAPFWAGCIRDALQPTKPSQVIATTAVIVIHTIRALVIVIVVGATCLWWWWWWWLWSGGNIVFGVDRRSSFPVITTSLLSTDPDLDVVVAGGPSSSPSS